MERISFGECWVTCSLQHSVFIHIERSRSRRRASWAKSGYLSDTHRPVGVVIFVDAKARLGSRGTGDSLFQWTMDGLLGPKMMVSRTTKDDKSLVISQHTKLFVDETK